MTVYDIAMEVLTEHRIGYDCSCGWQPTIGGILPDEQNEHRAAVFAERFGGVVLEPVENVALTIALAQVDRGESPPPNMAYVVVHTLARFRAALALLDGDHVRGPLPGAAE